MEQSFVATIKNLAYACDWCKFVPKSDADGASLSGYLHAVDSIIMLEKMRMSQETKLGIRKELKRILKFARIGSLQFKDPDRCLFLMEDKILSMARKQASKMHTTCLARAPLPAKPAIPVQLPAVMDNVWQPSVGEGCFGLPQHLLQSVNT